jgi:hypothetical protein
MKCLFISLSVLCAIAFTSCKKDYICVCTNVQTGEKSYGDHFRAGPILKKTAEESCKANNDVYNDLKDCHLE